MTEVSRLHLELVARVLDSDAKAPRETRRAAFDFDLASHAAMTAGAEHLLKRGYG